MDDQDKTTEYRLRWKHEHWRVEQLQKANRQLARTLKALGVRTVVRPVGFDWFTDVQHC